MKYYIIAGEASGDLHGSNLLRALFRQDPEAEVRYWGGDLMAEAVRERTAARAVQVRHIRDLAFMGIVEVVAHLGSILNNMRFCKRDILAFQPDVMVFIDYPSFNLKIAKFTHQHGIKNVHYISPQIWAWKTGRIRPMRRDLDKLCYILPTEQKFYADHSFPQALYVGHPLLDAVDRYRTLADGATQLQSLAAQVGDKKIIALLPGSRKQELRRMLPSMFRLAQRHPEYHYIVAGMSLIGEEFYRQFIPAAATNVSILYDRTYDLLASAYAGVVCSGTATLEAALFRMPEVVCYQCNRLSAAIARRLIASRISYISLVNLIADRPVVSELIQDDYNDQRLEEEFLKVTTQADSRQHMLDEYDRVITLLGGSGASDRTATAVIAVARGTVNNESDSEK